MTNWPNDIGRCQEQGEAATEVGHDDTPTSQFGAFCSALILVTLAVLVALLSFAIVVSLQ